MRFFNGQYLWETRDAAGAVTRKFLAPAQVAEAFRSAPLDSGWLPPGVVRAGGGARGEFACLFVPARRHRLPVERAGGRGVQTLDIWLPSFVFLGLAGSYRVWAVKTAALDPAAPLFHAPLPNVFGHGGVCWGTAAPPRASARTITTAWEIFAASTFNGHAASGKTRTHAGDVREVLRALARSKKRFPLGELIPFRDRDNTLDAVVGDIIGGAGE